MAITEDMKSWPAEHLDIGDAVEVRDAVREEYVHLVQKVDKFKRDLSPAEDAQLNSLLDRERELDKRIDGLLHERAGAAERRKLADAGQAFASRRPEYPHGYETRADGAIRPLGPNGQPVGGFTVRHEHRTYNRGNAISDDSRDGCRSFFADLFAASVKGDFMAQERLRRHQQEASVEGEISARSNSTSSMAGLVPPQYMIDEAALVVRARRPFASSIQRLQIPDEGMSLIVPRGTTGASAAVQSSENSATSLTDQVWSNVTLPVATIAGQLQPSRQTLERGAPGIDQLLFNDLAGAYATQVDLQALSGSGAAGQVLGILNTAGGYQYTGSGMSSPVSVAQFVSAINGALNAIETTRYMAADLIVMHPRRWRWLLAQLDSGNRPLVTPGQNGPYNSLASVVTPSSNPMDPSEAGTLFNTPVVTDANVPTAVGTGPEDQVLITRRADNLLYEDGDGMPKNLTFEQTLGNQLTVTLVAYNYVAFTAGRYPQSIAIVGGNSGTAGKGLVAPTF